MVITGVIKYGLMVNGTSSQSRKTQAPNCIVFDNVTTAGLSPRNDIHHPEWGLFPPLDHLVWFGIGFFCCPLRPRVEVSPKK
jgi:hypothetical protein